MPRTVLDIGGRVTIAAVPMIGGFAHHPAPEDATFATAPWRLRRRGYRWPPTERPGRLDPAEAATKALAENRRRASR